VAEEKVEVIAYSGYRSEEIPKAMILDGQKIGVAEILKMWIEEGIEDRSRKRFFKVRGGDGNTYQIYYDETVMEWFCRV
jgi:hypothetical protein